LKKIFSLFLAVLITVTAGIPAFAATRKGDTVTLSMENLEDLLPGNSQSGTYDQQLLSAQIQYLTYCNDMLITDSDTYTYNSKVQERDNAKKKYEQGYGSKKAYDDAVQAVTDQLNSQQQHSMKRSQDSLVLRHMLELDDVDKLVVKPMDYSKLDLEAKINNINYKSDLKKLGWNDLSGSDASDSEMTGGVEAFHTLYNALKSAGDQYHQNNDTYQKKLNDLQTTKQKVAAGYAFQKELDDLNQEVQVLANTVAQNKNSLYMAYLKYDYARDHNGESPDAVQYY